MNENQPAMQNEDEESRKETSPLPTRPSTAEPIIKTYAVMLREIRSWGWWSLALGVMHLFAGFLSAPWGIVLLIVGLASFYYHEAAMFVVYGVILGWVGLANMSGGETAWIIFGLLQLYLAFRVFRQFFQFRQAQEAYSDLLAEGILKSSPVSERAARTFPWIGGGVGALSLTVLIALLVSAIIMAAMNYEVPGFFNFAENLCVRLGVIGLAMSLASLLSGHRYKFVAAIGLAASILTLVIEFALTLIF